LIPAQELADVTLELDIHYSNDGGDKSKIGIVGCVLLSETRVTGANQRSVVSEMAHSCMQTSRHWGGN